MKDINRQHHELTDELARLQFKFSQLEDEKFALDTSVDKQTDKLAERETEYQVLMKDYEYAKEREAVLMGDK
jgi:predicted  nucleic acid-binding Zn-ribbon protein